MSIEGDFPKTHLFLQNTLNQKQIPSIAVGIWIKKNNQSYTYYGGLRRTTPEPIQPLQAENYFDLSSVSKVISTATLAALLHERAWLDLEAPIAYYLPDWRGTLAGQAQVKVWHLLTHTGGFPAWKPFWKEISYHESITIRYQQMIELLKAVPVESTPGSKVLYSDISFLILGLLIEAITDRSLEELFLEWIARPFGLKKLFYKKTNRSFLELQDEKAVATEFCEWRKIVLQGQVHDENCWAAGGVTGHAGLFGTLEDVLRFSIEIEKGFLTKKTKEKFFKPILFSDGNRRALGWDVPSIGHSLLGKFFSPQSVGHWGFTGTSLWMDLEKGFHVVLLTNRIHPSRENQNIRFFRPEFHDCLYSEALNLVRS